MVRPKTGGIAAKKKPAEAGQIWGQLPNLLRLPSPDAVQYRTERRAVFSEVIAEASTARRNWPLLHYAGVDQSTEALRQHGSRHAQPALEGDYILEKADRMCGSCERQAGTDEIEITPEMVGACLEALSEMLGEAIHEAIYREEDTARECLLRACAASKTQRRF